MLRAALVVAILALAGSPAAAQRTGPFVRVQLGAEKLETSWSDEGPKSLAGPGPALALAVGTVTSPRWTWRAELFDRDARALRYRTTLSNFDDDPVFDSVQLDLVGLGIGATHYFDGRDVYLSLMVAASAMRFTTDRFPAGRASTWSDLGPALTIEGGRDFWIAEHATLGVSVSLFAARVTHDYRDRTLETFGLALSLSGAYYR